MTNTEYWDLVNSIAKQFVDDNSNPADATTHPETAFNELVDGVVDCNWSEEDAISCLQLSHHPSAEVFQHGSYRAKTANEAFPFYTFAGSAFAMDVKEAIAKLNFDWEAYDRIREEAAE